MNVSRSLVEISRHGEVKRGKETDIWNLTSKVKSHDIRREDGPGVSVLKRHYVFILRPAKIFFAYLLHFYLLHLYPQVPQVIVEVYMKQNFSFFLCALRNKNRNFSKSKESDSLGRLK